MSTMLVEPMPPENLWDEVVPHTEPTNFRALAVTLEKLKRVRLSWEKRANDFKQNGDTDSFRCSEAVDYQAIFESFEARLLKSIKTALREHPAWPWLEKVRGIGPSIAGRLLADIDISKCRHVSSLWSYAGYAPKDGKTMRPEKGVKLPYNSTLRSVCFCIADLFIKLKNEHYTRIYYSAKEYYKANRPDWTPKHIDMAARRKMMKIFLQHLWLEWRKAEGLPVTMPYVHDKLGHRGLVEPSTLSNPRVGSEPKILSNPVGKSEPDSESNP